MYDPGSKYDKYSYNIMCNRACEIVSLSQAAFSFIFGREENRPNIKEEISVWLREATCEKQSCVPKTIADFSNLLYYNLLSLLLLLQSLMGFCCSVQKWDTPLRT